MSVAKKIVLIITMGFVLTNCSINDKEELNIEFVINPKLSDSIPSLQVSFDYKSDSSGLITLRYENNSWGDNNIFNCLKEIDVVPKPKEVTFLSDSSKIVIKTEPNLNSTVNYSIIQDYKGVPLNQKRYRPIIDSTYFHVLGMRLFAVPEGVFKSDTSKVNIKINYALKTSNEMFHSSFGKNKFQNINVTRDELYASFFVGGDFRRYSFTNKKDTTFFVTRGNWKSFTDKDILSILERVIKSQRDFWKDERKSNFSVSLIPTYESWYSIGGSGFSSSFISFASNNNKVTLSNMRWLYNHELLHKYIGRTIINESDVTQYWFSEGFTDYYSYKLQLKYSQLNVFEFINTINSEVVIPHYKDSTNNTPNDKLTYGKYWGNYQKYMKLPYRRGLLYAFLIDNQIKENSNYKLSLDNLMLDLYKSSLKDKDMRLNQSVFISTLSKYLKTSNVESDFQKYILKGELIDFKNHLPNEISIYYQDNIPLFKIDKVHSSELEKKLKM